MPTATFHFPLVGDYIELLDYYKLQNPLLPPAHQRDIDVESVSSIKPLLLGSPRFPKSAFTGGRHLCLVACTPGQSAFRLRGRSMRPYLLKGHERPLTQVKYNREGDLLFSCARDHFPTLWYSEDGTRVGTYIGHKGAIFTCDVSWDSYFLITASADSSAKIWAVETGECLHTFAYKQPCRAVTLSLGDKLAALSTDPFMSEQSAIRVLSIAEDPRDCDSEALLTIPGSTKRFTRLAFTELNTRLLSTGEDGFVRLWDVETGKELESDKIHDATINDMQLSEDCSHFVTASTDKTAKLVDTQTLNVLKTYQTERNANSAALSPIEDHVLIGGGQEASQVTTTSSRAGRFESRFFHKIFQEEFGTVRGHFGPINAVAFHPDGRSFASGGEDGYVRLHHFDTEYLGSRFF